MSAVPTTTPIRLSRRRIGDRIGDLSLRGITLAAGLATVVLLAAIVYKVFHLANRSITHYGVAFLVHRTWDPVKGIFGALPFIYGTAVSSAIALALATPLGGQTAKRSTIALGSLYEGNGAIAAPRYAANVKSGPGTAWAAP